MALATVSFIALAACGSSTASSDTTTGQAFNDADVMFAQMMIPHHEQAIEMSDIALDPTIGVVQGIRDLATQIKAAQDPEIMQMTQWLSDWKQPLTADEGVDHSSMMSGMLTAEELSELGTLRGAAFDGRWAQAMIAHHEGAIQMAQDVLKDGKNPAVLALANEITTSQNGEIEVLRGYLTPAQP
ncbi:MAG: DUF305 domain-containing protein [Actinobacteria bacterium]|nr:DUF305 domain-containing protein [Actinomycetota bacterium]MSZ31773.1 DUF305 domain-containing protein [Actinomycetota bacterium]